MSEKELSKKDVEQISKEIAAQNESILAQTFGKEGVENSPATNIKDIEAVKIVMHELLNVDRHIPSTTNLTKRQIYAVARMQTFNKLSKSPLIDSYLKTMLELKRSETVEPTNLLKGLLDLATYHVNTLDSNVFKRIIGSRK